MGAHAVTNILPQQSRYNIIDIAQLPAMEVLEQLDSEATIVARMRKLVEIWKSYDPPSAANYDVENLEFDPLRINQEASTYFELLLRDRVNQAARAVTLAFSINGDLDAIASRYPGGVPRQDDETDDHYRRRILLAPNMLSPHGSYEAYVFWALSANINLRDASATTKKGTGAITITVLQEGSDPKPTSTQLLEVYTYINDRSRRGLTDYIYVQPPKIVNTKYRARVWCFPGPDPTTVVATIKEALEDLVEEQRWLGYDHTLLAINAALFQSGVYNAIIDEPTADLIAGTDGYINVTGIELTYVGRGE